MASDGDNGWSFEKERAHRVMMWADLNGSDLADVISEIGEYSEGLAPNDLRGAVEWLIREETASRVKFDALRLAVREYLSYPTLAGARQKLNEALDA